MPSAYSVFKPEENTKYPLYCVVWSDSGSILSNVSVIFEITSDINNFNYTCIISYNTDTGTIQFVKNDSITFEEYAKNGVHVLMFEINEKQNIIYEISKPYRLWNLYISDIKSNVNLTVVVSDPIIQQNLNKDGGTLTILSPTDGKYVLGGDDGTTLSFTLIFYIFVGDVIKNVMITYEIDCSLCNNSFCWPEEQYQHYLYYTQVR